jgi:hypothetical protein
MFLYTFFLWLHILSAIIAFGPTFSFPIIGSMVAKEPQHALFAVKFQESVTMRMLYPVGLVVLPIAGIGMILSKPINLFHATWLIGAIVLFIIAALYSTIVQTPTGMKLMHALEKMPPGPPPEGSTGPPPEIAAMVKKLKMGGMFLTIMVVVILVIMVFGANGKLGGTY